MMMRCGEYQVSIENATRDFCPSDSAPILRCAFLSGGGAGIWKRNSRSLSIVEIFVTRLSSLARNCACVDHFLLP